MIPEDTVKYIADLARIHLNKDETKSFTKDLVSILDYINKLSKLEVSEIEPTSHVIPMQNVFREDKVQPSLKQKEALDVAVTSYKGFFKVIKVIE